MRALALVTALAACGHESPSSISLAGVAPAVDALIAAVKSGSVARLDPLIAEPIGVPLRHPTKLWRLAGAKTRLAGVDAGGGVVLWDARTARPLARYRSAVTAPEQIAISLDGEKLELCGAGVVEIIELGTGVAKLDTGTCTQESKERFVATPRGLVDPESDRPVLAIPDTVALMGDALATLGADDTATLWTFGGLLIGHSDAIVSIVPRDDRLLTASRDGLAIVWKNSAIQHVLPRATSPLVGAGFVTDTRAAVGDADGNATLYDLDSSAALAHWSYPGGLACLVVLRDGHVAVATKDGQFESRDAVLAHPTPLAAAPCTPATATSAMAGEWKITGDDHGNLRIHPTTLAGAVARACGILRRFDRADGVCD